MLRKLITIMLVGLLCVPVSAIAGELPDAPSAIKQSENAKKDADNLQLPGKSSAVAPKDGTKRKVQDWQNLEKIRPGDRVQVVDNRLRVQSGEFEAFAQDDLTLRAGGNNVVIPRQDVYRVTVLRRARGRNIKRGLLIGAGVGAGLGVAGGIHAATHKNFQLTEIDKAVLTGVAVGATVVGGGVGALVGAAMNPDLDVYRSAVKPNTTASLGHIENKE